MVAIIIKDILTPLKKPRFIHAFYPSKTIPKASYSEGKINKLGSNHVEVKLKGDGRFKNFWLSDICLNN